MAQDFGQLPRSSSPAKSTFAQDWSLVKPKSSVATTLPSRSRNRNKLPILPIIGLVVLIIGAVAAMLALQTNLDLRQWAWGGVKVNEGALAGQQMNLSSAASLAGQNQEAAKLFVSLTETYYDADAVNIDIPAFQIKGVVFKKYDADLDQTFVFGRLENLPLIQAIPRMWLSSGDVYVPAGIGQLTLENDVPVGYFLTVLEGESIAYETLHFSYDKAVNQKTPSATFLSVDFDDPIASTEVQQ